jgi:hypothetical protein
MVESYIQLPEDGIGKKTRSNLLTLGSEDVHQQIVQLADENGDPVVFSTGALATIENQEALLAELEKKANLEDEQPVSLASLPLPLGASTADKQDTIISSLSAILSELAAKTESEEIQLTDLLLAIKVLSQAIANPSYVDKSANQLRVQATISSGTVTTVTTVSGLTNIDSFAGRNLMTWQNQSAWGSVVRGRIG